MSRKLQGRFLVIDQETGDYIDLDCDDPAQLWQAIRGTAKAVDKAKLNIGKSRKDQFIMSNQAKLVDLVLDESVTRSEIRIWVYCLAKSKWGGRLTMSQSVIASELGMGKSTVSTALKKFIEMGYLTRKRDKDGNVIHVISDDVAIKGKRELFGTNKIAKAERQTPTGNTLKAV